MRNDIAAVRVLLGLDGGASALQASAATSSAAAATASSCTPQRNGFGGKPAADAGAGAAAAAPAEALPSCNGHVDVCEEHGWTPLIQAVALPHDSGVPIARVLLDKGADPAIFDKNGFSTMHWAAACGNVGCIATLHAAGADINVRARRPALRRPGAPLCRSIGETPLHRAARLGAVSCIRQLCELGADIFRPSAFHATALDVAGEYNGRVVPANRASVRKALTERAPSLTTLVLHHDDCLQHLTPHEHQEAPGRITAIMDAINDPARFESWELKVSSAFQMCVVLARPPARPCARARDVGAAGCSRRQARSRGEGRSRARAAHCAPTPCVHTNSHAPHRCSWPQVVRVHATSYVQMVRNLDLKVRGNPGADEPVPFTPHVQRSIGMSERRIKRDGMSDTAFSKGSLRAALRAAGSVCKAIDSVVAGEHRNAFCVVRPPGHHAGVNGLEDGAHFFSFLSFRFFCFCFLIYSFVCSVLLKVRTRAAFASSTPSRSVRCTHSISTRGAESTASRSVSVLYLPLHSTRIMLTI